jgi:hypothetical protein
MGLKKVSTKSRDECEMSFRIIEGILDKAVEGLKADLVDFDFIDSSNRNGFEKYVSPYYLWSFTIKKDTHKGYIERCVVIIEYLEPQDWGVSKSINVSSVAEKFNTGQPSFFKEKHTQIIEADKASVEAITDFIKRAIIKTRDLLTG